MHQVLSLITFGVRDMHKSLEFYEKGLGWKRSDLSTADLVVFNVGGIALALYSWHSLAKDANLSEQGNGFPGITLSMNLRSEKEVDGVLKKVKKHGATIVKPAEKAFWGGYSGYFSDYDGHLIEVAFNPFWELNENGQFKL